MTEADWLTATDPRPMLEFLRGQASDRKLRLLGVASCRPICHLMKDERSRNAVEAAERFADENDMQRLGTAYQQAEAAAYAAEDAVGPDENYAPVAAAWAARAASASWESVVGSTSEAMRWALTTVATREFGDALASLLRDIFGNPFRPVAFDPARRSETVAALAAGIYAERAFDRLPILADALEEAGCDQPDILNHCRGPGPHVRGCWAVDLVLGKE